MNNGPVGEAVESGPATVRQLEGATEMIGLIERSKGRCPGVGSGNASVDPAKAPPRLGRSHWRIARAERAFETGFPSTEVLLGGSSRLGLHSLLPSKSRIPGRKRHSVGSIESVF
jgi:hypothetical protein